MANSKNLTGILVGGVLALALIGCAVERPAPGPATPRPAATARPTETTVPVATLTPTPPVWWQSELYEVADVSTGGTYLMAPQEVIEQVIAHYDDARALARIDALEAYRAALPRYYSGAMLEEQLAQALEAIRYEIHLEGFVRTYEVKDFSRDGLACTVGARQRGGKVFLKNRTTGETVEAFSDTLTIVRMRYDPNEARWKGTRLVGIIEMRQ